MTKIVPVPGDVIETVRRPNSTGLDLECGRRALILALKVKVIEDPGHPSGFVEKLYGRALLFEEALWTDVDGNLVWEKFIYPRLIWTLLEDYESISVWLTCRILCAAGDTSWGNLHEASDDKAG